MIHLIPLFGYLAVFASAITLLWWLCGVWSRAAWQGAANDRVNRDLGWMWKSLKQDSE